MTTWEQWVHRPRSLWLRKALFQVHLWAGISLGLYVIVVCLSGSAAVFNSELYTAFEPEPMLVARAGPRMSRADVRKAAQRAYSGRSITRVSVSPNPCEAATVSFGTSVFADRDSSILTREGTLATRGLSVCGWSASSRCFI